MTSYSWLRPNRRRLVGLTQAALAALALTACSPAPAPPVEMSAETAAAGAALYEQSCAMCHFDGKDSLAAPRLIGSAMVQSADPKALIVTIVRGLNNTTVVDGKKFGGIMPPTSGLSDEEIAIITTYVQQRYGGVKRVTTAAEVAAALK